MSEIFNTKFWGADRIRRKVNDNRSAEIFLKKELEMKKICLFFSLRRWRAGPGILGKGSWKGGELFQPFSTMDKKPKGGFKNEGIECCKEFHGFTGVWGGGGPADRLFVQQKP
jgi:hypothetical protein